MDFFLACHDDHCKIVLLYFFSLPQHIMFIMASFNLLGDPGTTGLVPALCVLTGIETLDLRFCISAKINCLEIKLVYLDFLDSGFEHQNNKSLWCTEVLQSSNLLVLKNH